MTTGSDAKQVGDVAALATTGFSLLELLPALAAVFSIIWLSMRIYESITGTEVSDSRFAIWLTNLFTRKSKREEKDDDV